jgi:elongation factor P
MKNVRTGSIMETALKGSDSKFKLCYIDRKKMQFIYSTGESFAFMDNETYEQIEIPAERLEWEKNFLQEGMEVNVEFYGEEILTVELPDKVTLKVTQCDPAVKGDTKTNATKDAFLESGFLVKVPMFINQDESIVVSTIDGSYVSRG